MQQPVSSLRRSSSKGSKKIITHSKCVLRPATEMSQRAISSTNVISEGVSRLIKMGSGFSLRAHQITERPFIATLFCHNP